MEYHVYILLSLKDHKFYIGYTANLKARLDQHIAGKVESTRFRRPLQLIHHESYINKDDAKRNEIYYKTTKGRNDLRKKLSAVLNELLPKESSVVAPKAFGA